METARVRVQFADGSEQFVAVQEQSANNAYLVGSLSVTSKPVSVAYGYGYMEVWSRID